MMREAIITSSVLILCITLLRQMFKDRISACLQYALWLIVAVRLIIPGIAVVFPNILPVSDLSIMNAADRAVAQNYTAQALENYDITSGGLPFLTEDIENGPAFGFLSAGSMPAWAYFLKGIWCLGILIAGVWMITVNIIFMNKLRKSRIRYEKEEFELPVSLPVYMVKDLTSPCLYGLPGRQAIYLPESVIEDEDKVKHILAHEYCHYRHRDVFWSALRCIILAVYWFHPLVWLAAVLSKQDCELACDEAAIRLLGEEERVAYGKTLVALITRKTKASDIVCAATTMTGGLESVKERVRRIAEKPHRLMIAMVPVIVVVGVVAVFTFTQAKEVPDGACILEGESSLTVTTDCFQVTFPEYLTKKTYYRGQNGTDIIVYHKDSNREIGRFCMLPYEEAVKLADEKEVILIGNYGANSALNSYIKGYDMMSHADVVMHEYTPAESRQDFATEHEYTPTGADEAVGGVPGTDSNVEETSSTYLPNESITVMGSGENVAIEHEYTPAESDESAAGVPGTDSDNDETTYIIHDSLGDAPVIPAPEDVDSEFINLPYEETPEHEAAHNERSTDYLPNERIVEISIAPTSDTPCYLYIPADNSDADSKYQTELYGMNQKLIELTDYVSVLSVSIESMKEVLDIMMENRTPYVGDSVKTSKIAGAIPTTAELGYQYLSMETTTEPYGVTLYYHLYGEFGKADSDMQFMGAVLMFASIENLKQCTIQIKDINNPIMTEATTEYQYSREEMEELFGPLYPCSETKESFVDLYNRVLEYLGD